MPDVLVCVATELEALDFPSVFEIGSRSVEVLVTGIGPVNAAISLTRFLTCNTVGTVISMGVGGAYAGSGLEIGDVVCASSEFYSDLGADSSDGFLDMKALGFTVVGGYCNRLPLDTFPTENRHPFVTRSTCTGNASDGDSIRSRTGGSVESMEGAAVVHTAIEFGLPVGEIRGISNMVGNRDRAAWRVGDAARGAGDALIRWLEEGAC